MIRWLYNRPLETLLATFGMSVALQQLAKNIFGTQARPLTAPGWLDGALVLNDVVAISLHPHRHLRSRALLSRCLSLHSEAHPAGSGNPGGDTEPAHGSLDGDQSRDGSTC